MNDHEGNETIGTNYGILDITRPFQHQVVRTMGDR